MLLWFALFFGGIMSCIYFLHLGRFTIGRFTIEDVFDCLGALLALGRLSMDGVEREIFFPSLLVLSWSFDHWARCSSCMGAQGFIPLKPSICFRFTFPLFATTHFLFLSSALAHPRSCWLSCNWTLQGLYPALDGVIWRRARSKSHRFSSAASTSGVWKLGGTVYWRMRGGHLLSSLGDVRILSEQGVFNAG